MKFLRGVVYSLFQGTPSEFWEVKKLLQFENKPSYMNEEGILYTGLVDFVQEKLGEKYLVEIEDMPDNLRPALSIRDINIPDDYIRFENPEHRIRPYQIVASKKALVRGRGIVEIATGGGKTEIMAILIKYLLEHGLAKKIYVIAGTCFLMEQAADRFETRGLEGVSRFGSGNKFKPARIQVCVVDSLTAGLYGNAEVVQDFSECDAIFFDEAHHLKAETWTHLGELCKARYRYGMTATLWADPTKFSWEDFFLIGLTGGILCNIPSSVLRNMGYLADPLVTMVKIDGPVIEARQWENVYRSGIVEHPTRNSAILSIAESLYNGKYKTLVFVKQITHGLLLMKHLRLSGCKHVYFVKGGKKIFKYLPSGRFQMDYIDTRALSELVNTEEKVVIIGTQVLDEGVDIPSFNALIMGSAMKKYRRTVQRAGRGMRPKPGENKVYLFDFMDNHAKSLGEHSEYRVQTYQLEEFEFSQSIKQTEERMGCPIVLQNDIFTFEKLKYKDDPVDDE